MLLISSYFFCSLINRHYSSWVSSLFGCYYFKSCRCWMWCRSDMHPCSFFLALIWKKIQATAHAAIFVHAIEEHALRAQYNGWQDSKICFYWHMAWQYLIFFNNKKIWWQFADFILKLPHQLFCVSLTSAWCWGVVGCASEKFPVWSDRKDILHLNKCNSCQEKNRQKQQLWLGRIGLYFT